MQYCIDRTLQQCGRVLPRVWAVCEDERVGEQDSNPLEVSGRVLMSTLSSIRLPHTNRPLPLSDTPCSTTSVRSRLSAAVGELCDAAGLNGSLHRPGAKPTGCYYSQPSLAIDSLPPPPPFQQARCCLTWNKQTEWRVHCWYLQWRRVLWSTLHITCIQRKQPSRVVIASYAIHVTCPPVVNHATPSRSSDKCQVLE